MNRITDQQGLAMPVALLVTLVISLLAVALWHYGTAGIKQVENLSEENRAHYLARSAAEATVAYIMQDQITADVQNRIDGLVGEETVANGVTIDGESAPVTVEVKANNSDNTDITIESTATVDGMKSVVRRHLYKSPNLVAIGNSGKILTYDGTNWRDQSVNPDTGQQWTTRNLNGITWGTPAPDESLLVAVGSDRTIITSLDGITWTTRESGHGNNLSAVTWGTVTVDGEDTGLFVAVGEGGTILTSPDGIVWTSRNSGTSEQLNGVAWGNGTFVAVGENGTVIRSTNGSTWSAGSSSGDFGKEDYHFNDVAWGNNMFLAVADRRVETFLFFTNRYFLWATSEDGSTWTRRSDWDDSDARDLMTVGWSPVAMYFGAGGTNGTVVQFRRNGRSIADNYSEVNDTIYGNYMDGTLLWAVGHSELIACYDLNNELVTAYDLHQVYHLNDITAINPASGSGVWRIDTMD